MKPQRMLGGVIIGACSALLANVLLFGSLFMDGSAEVAVLVFAGLVLLFAVGAVGVTALMRPTDTRPFGAPARRRLRNVA